MDHNGTWGMLLADDGTMDTVIRCSDCDAEYRYNYLSVEDTEESYENFVERCLDDASNVHTSEMES